MRFHVSLIFIPIFVALVTSFDLKCTPQSGVLTFLGSTNYCKVHSLNITSPNEIITSINGVATPTTFQGLDIQHTVVHYLPKGIGKFFPQLRGLLMYSTGLKSIQAADLEGLSNLEGLYIAATPIEELPSDLFKYTPEINDLFIVGNNQLSRVGKDLFTNFQSFRRIYFSSNKCISAETSSGFETTKSELRTKCPYPNEKLSSEVSKKLENEIASLKTKHSQREVELEKKIEELKSQKSSLEVENKQLKTETEGLKRTRYHGLLDSATRLLHKVTRQLKECRKGKTTTEKVGKGVEIVLKVLSATENATTVELNVESTESKVTKIVDASGNSVQLNQTEIVIDQQSALFLPVNLGQFFKSLQRLSVTFSGLYGLDTRTFSGMQNLVAINFTGNKLVEISEDAFAELADLKELDLSHNNIEVIDEEAFEKNVDLEILRLNHNQLTAITSSIFKYQKKLRMLLLNDNKMKFINAMLLSTLMALETVDLRSNECIDSSLRNTTLKEIESKIMDQCIPPVELKCNHEIQDNQTDETYCHAESLELIYPGTTLSMGMTENGEKIEKLSIIDQKMLFMPSKISETLPNLIQLIVEKSQLTALHKTNFECLTSMKEITIEKNNISLIEEGVFDEVPQITYLNLGYNHIESLPPMAFVQLTKLKTLVLSGNKLKTFTASLLSTKPVITNIQLRENLLEMIESKVIRMLKKADLIDLGNNTCIDMKYQKSDAKGRSLMEISGYIDFECVTTEEQS